MTDYNKTKEVNEILADQIINGEVRVSIENQRPMNDDFEMFVQLLDSDRQDKDYDWMSDIRIPEFASHHLTQSSIDVSQYFQTRDFVEVYLEDESEEAKANANASKELLNRTLNQRHLNHYLKFVRAKGLNNLCGRVYLKCWWEQETEVGVVDYETKYEESGFDVYGDPLLSPEQEPAYNESEEPVLGDVPVIDRFNYDVWDQRNVFTDNSYVYSLQQKQWVTFRSEMTLTELEDSADVNGYFNLDRLKEIEPAHKTQYKSETIDKDASRNPTNTAIEKPYDIYERYGAFWTIPGETGKKAIGIDNEGKPLEKAEMREVIITVAAAENKRVLIGFKPTPYIDASGSPYRPIIRGLCYIHLTEDGGVGDGKYTKELQIAIDDTFNISQDRTMLATLPTLSVNKHNIEDNSSLYFEPGHPMERTDKDDIVEFKISDNITAALQQMSLLTSKMQQVDSIQPPTMGETGQASTTATAYAGASYATGERTNYKSLTFEHTALTELYWMIQQMTLQFAHPETGLQLMGDKVYDFDPEKNYYYKPLSQSIEPEHSKMAKIQQWVTIVGYIAQSPHPGAPAMFNYIMGEIVKLMGDETANFADKFLDESQPMQSQEAGVGAVAGGGVPVSNQNMLPMSGAEMGTRGIANIGTV